MVAGVVAAAAFLAVGPANFCLHSDAPSFLRVARDPFGSGRHFPAPLALGVAYRYGRILYPLSAWVLALGRPAAVPWTLAAVYAVSAAIWFAATAELIERVGASPRRMLLLVGAPFVLVLVFSPVVAAEPMAGALVLLAYLFAQDGRWRASAVSAALAILTREMMAVAFLPLAWQAWRTRRWRGLAEWLVVALPYLVWASYVRVRVGVFPFLDPASTRRAAFAPPFVGWVETLRAHPGVGDLLGMTIGAVTLAIAAAMVWRRAWTTPVQQAAIVSCGFVVCYGRAVWQYPTEAVRVMAPAQVLLFVAIVSTRRGGIRDGRGAEVSGCPTATRSNDESDLLLRALP